jgi:hypothetical protein
MQRHSAWCKGEVPVNRNEWLDTLPKGSVGAEIGVAAATYSIQMLQRVKPSKLYLVDRWALILNPGAKGKKELQMHAALSKLAEYVARGIAMPICAWSFYATRWIPDATLDWLYIDGDHKPKSVREDLLAWYPKVKPGGIVAGHDYKEGLGPYDGINQGIKDLGIKPKINVVEPESRAPTFWFRREA